MNQATDTRTQTQTAKKPGPFRLLKDGIYGLERAGETLDQNSLFWTIEVVPALTDARASLAALAEKKQDWKKVQAAITRLTDVRGRAEEIVNTILSARRIGTARDSIRRSVASLRTAIKIEAKRQEAKKSLFHRGEMVDLDGLARDANAAEMALEDTPEHVWTLAEIEAERANIRGKEQKLWTLIKTSCDFCGRPKGEKPVVYERKRGDGSVVHREYCCDKCNELAAKRARQKSGNPTFVRGQQVRPRQVA